VATKAEPDLGKALKELRDQVVVGTEVGRYGESRFDFSAAHVTASVDELLARLGVDRLDVVQCHDMEFGYLDPVVNETLPALVKLREAGKVWAVGITGCPLDMFPYVLDRVPLGTWTWRSLIATTCSPTGRWRGCCLSSKPQVSVPSTPPRCRWGS